MNKYQNEEYLKNKIMEQNRHQFIYGYQNNTREAFLKRLSDEYPIKMNENSPMAIYLNEIGLPAIVKCNNLVDRDKINTISNEYLYFTIAINIIKKSLTTININDLNDKFKRIISFINTHSLNSKYSQIKDIEELLYLFELSQDFYFKYYIRYMTLGKENGSIYDIAIPFLQLDAFISQYKKSLNNNSYFSLIMEKTRPISIASTQSINYLIGGRINKDISMKIATEPDDWPTYYDQSGQLIENVHDYSIVELDDSYNNYTKKLIK